MAEHQVIKSFRRYTVNKSADFPVRAANADIQRADLDLVRLESNRLGFRKRSSVCANETAFMKFGDAAREVLGRGRTLIEF